MSTTFLSQFMGPVLVAAAIGFILHPKFGKKMMKDFEEHEGLTYFTGIIIMILGLIVILNHNIWEFSAACLVTLIGWGSFLKGVGFLIAPNFLFELSKPIIKNAGVMKFAMFVWLVVGVYLSWLGYFA